ncbi:hypothetical protein EV700_1571 [Fluviicoccus keumensis]|uniref:Periplasmic protein n=1 Tax=Fluviicoccus keumensis TaxID=1435465 RepID=A0A4Q7Z9F6_9GAMM|nr:hypothetical protein [Fluviicoccus keumensis]RZU47177.1 hypothetical protein EV700_1571 [Fluviicoccus keumensis]
MSIRTLAALALTVITSSALAAEGGERKCGAGSCSKKGAHKTVKHDGSCSKKEAKGAKEASCSKKDVAGVSVKEASCSKKDMPAMDNAAAKMEMPAKDASCSKKDASCSKK